MGSNQDRVVPKRFIATTLPYNARNSYLHILKIICMSRSFARYNEELWLKSIKSEEGSTKTTSTSMFSSPYKSIAFSSESPTVPNSSGVKTVVATYSGENITSTVLDCSRNCRRV